MPRMNDQPSFMVLMRMGQANTAAHLQPLADAVAPTILHVVRPGPRPEALEARNIQYWEVKGCFRLSQVLRTLLQGLHVAARHDIRLVMSFNGFPYGVLAGLVSRVARAPFHVGFIGSDLHAARSNPIRGRLVSYATFCTTPGKPSTVLLRQIGYRGPIGELPHGVDTKRFRYVEAPRDISCLFVGALVAHKRVDCLIRAMARVKVNHPGANLVIVGDGPLRYELEALAKDEGVAESTSFVGQRARPEMWMKRAKMLVMPSEWEGMPYAMIEAMRCGTVPIVSPVGSIEDLVADNDNGLILADRTVETVSEAIIGLLEDSDRLHRLSRRAAESTCELSLESVSKTWRGLLELFGDPRSPQTATTDQSSTEVRPD